MKVFNFFQQIIEGLNNICASHLGAKSESSKENNNIIKSITYITSELDAFLLLLNDLQFSSPIIWRNAFCMHLIPSKHFRGVFIVEDGSTHKKYGVRGPNEQIAFFVIGKIEQKTLLVKA